jgi:predicted GNAT family acetyltransferase
MVTVTRNDENSRYEALLDGQPAGFVQFRQRPGKVVLIHTETDPAYEGRGVGSALARGALDDVRARGEKARVECPFIRAYIERHPEYADLVEPA